MQLSEMKSLGVLRWNLPHSGYVTESQQFTEFDLVYLPDDVIILKATTIPK